MRGMRRAIRSAFCEQIPRFSLNRRSDPLRARASVSENPFRRKSWHEVVEECDDASSLAVREKLDSDWPLWLDPSSQKKVNGFSFFRDTKNRHPDKIVLVRSGGHYEAVGIDALMLKRFGQMNLVGGDVPRVRCPRMHLEYHLHLMVRKAGFEVVIGEPSSELYGSSSGRSKRRLYEAAVIGGAGDAFYLNSADPGDLMSLDMESEGTHPLAAVCWSQTGFALIQYYAKEHVLRMTTRLSEEGLWAKLSSTGLTAPLYLHASSLTGAKTDAAFQGWQKRAQRIASSVFGPVQSYSSENPFNGFLQKILDKRPAKDPREAPILKEDVHERTAPPPLSTVSEIGVSPRPNSGVLPIMDFLLPDNCPKLVVRWMRQCIMDPPPPEIALEIQSVCRELKQTPCSIPQLNARLAPNRIVDMLTGSRWSVEFLDEIRRLLTGFTTFLEDPGTETISTSLLKIVQQEVRRAMDKSDLQQQCQECISRINRLLSENLTEYYERRGGNGARAKITGSLAEAVSGENLNQFLKMTKPELYSASNLEQPSINDPDISDLERYLTEDYENVFIPWARQMAISDVQFHSDECIISVKNTGTRRALASNDPMKRFQVKGGYYEAPPLLDMLRRYREGLRKWEGKFQEQIEELVEYLYGGLPYIISAAHASVTLTALTQHVIQAEENEWCLPDITGLVSRSQGSLEIHKFWPYWLQNEEGTSNSISLKTMAVLTGPNMAGKSTILRSIAAVCCLGVCGFFVPARAAILPFMDCVNLKTLLTDSPLENLSAFAMEMTEMKHVLHDATEHTLVLIDELGKGTEVIGGTAISAAIFKELYDRRAIGIFATHLHRIQDFQQDFPNAAFYRMEIEMDPDGERAATWKLCPGFCEESLGLEVALRQGIPRSIVERAEELINNTPTV